MRKFFLCNPSHFGWIIGILKTFQSLSIDFRFKKLYSLIFFSTSVTLETLDYPWKIFPGSYQNNYSNKILFLRIFSLANIKGSMTLGGQLSKMPSPIHITWLVVPWGQYCPFHLYCRLEYTMSNVYYISCYGYKTWTCNIICYDIIPILPYTLFFVLTWKRLKNSSKSYKSFCIAVVGGPKEIAKEIGSQMGLFFRKVLLHSHKKISEATRR